MRDGCAKKGGCLCGGKNPKLPPGGFIVWLGWRAQKVDEAIIAGAIGYLGTAWRWWLARRYADTSRLDEHGLRHASQSLQGNAAMAGAFWMAAVIGIYLLIAARGFKVALMANDGFSKLLATGLTTVFAFQAFVIIGGVTRVIPLTGVTLPLVSYGGSSILANFILLALLLLVSNRARREAREGTAGPPTGVWS